LTTTLHLTAEEKAILAGEGGPGRQRAMEIVVALGRIYDAARLIPIVQAHIAGVSYKNLGEAGLDFLSAWAAEGARVTVPTSLNPMGMEEARWREIGFQPDFALPQLRAVEVFRQMGIAPTLSCTPYLFAAQMPRRGEHLAWAESSAVVFANSVLAARSNREGGPSALAAAIVGRTAAYGLHLEAGRRANWVVDVKIPLRNVADFGALGYVVGRVVGNGIPYFRDLARWLPPLPSREQLADGGAAVDRLKAMGAALAAYGAVPLYHIDGYTPEAKDAGEALVAPDARYLQVDRLTPAIAAMDADPDVQQIDLVTIGCPHASLHELSLVADFVGGKQLRTKLWVTTARQTRQRGLDAGYVQRIEAAGGLVVADTCAVVAPLRSLHIHTMATNAGKMACYAPAHSGVKMRFGSLEQCLEAALSGFWPADAIETHSG